MKNIKLLKRLTACALVMVLAVPLSSMSQTVEEIYKPEELEQILAPIALYPDALLAQVLAAATYPLEVVEADRLIKENPQLQGEALLEAAKDKDWDPSIKAMLAFADTLAMMDAQLEWTRKLGTAFLAQPSDCMDAVQRLRQKAYAQGNLSTTGEQVIRVEPQTQIIYVEPASPEVVYVPVYDPLMIYGAWSYPGYPPYYFYPERYTGIAFFGGVYVGAFWGSWGAWDCNWHSRHVHVDLPRYNHFTHAAYQQGGNYRSYQPGPGDQPWRYDDRHRPNAGPRNPAPGRPNTPVVRTYNQNTVSSPRINTRDTVRTTINPQRDSRNSQPRIIRQPATPSVSTRDTRGDTNDRIIARPAPRASSPRDDDNRVQDPRGREGRSQIRPSIQGPEVLREGPQGVVVP